MYVVRLCKGLSYDGFISATIRQPDVVLATADEAEMAVATGYFTLVSVPEDNGGQNDNGNDADDIDIAKMTKQELEEYAKENGIDLQGCKNNGERVARILAANPSPASGAKKEGDSGENMEIDMN